VVVKVTQDVSGVKLVDRNIRAGDIRPKLGNEEQLMAMDALLDDSIPVVVLTGRAGSGKTILALAAALAKRKESQYNSIILTKPMVQVGGQELGILPGEVGEKFLPYLGNYTGNIEQIVGNVPTDLGQLGMEILPIQLIRGVSWASKFVLADEVQTLSRDEILTLGTRVGGNTKLVLMGDLRQRDIDIKIKDTGLFGLTDSYRFNESPLTAFVELKKVERSPVTELFTEIFEAG
jgi:PhoH-like ATPase